MSRASLDVTDPSETAAKPSFRTEAYSLVTTLILDCAPQMSAAR